MLPAFLITLREVIEATLIVVTIGGILVKLNQRKSLKTLLFAALTAFGASVLLLGLGSLLGLKVQESFSGQTEQIFEGTLMIISAIFITWAVFWLHKYFSRQKLKLLQNVKSTVRTKSDKALFILVFTAVFREGFEIVLFLSTIFLQSRPLFVFAGFGLGLVAGIIITLAFFKAALKLPVFRAFQLTTLLLILFAAGLLVRGVHEFSEAGMIPEISSVSLNFLPAGIAGDLLKSLFGWSQNMDYLGLALYASYIAFMRWFLFQRKSNVLFAIDKSTPQDLI